jgi:hypothetical protein
MGHERWFRGQQDGHGRPFDWRVAAREHGVPERLAVALYEQAMQQAHGATPAVVQDRYLALLADARRQAARPSPGKVTRTMRLQAERAGQRRALRVSQLTGEPLAPGKRTLSSYIQPTVRGARDQDQAHAEGQRLAAARPGRADGIDTAHERAAGARPDLAAIDRDIAVSLGFFELYQAPDVEADHALAPEADQGPEPLPEATRERMARAFGEDFDDVVVHVDSPEATGATRALTRGRDIHFRAGAYAPGTAEGDWLIAHELAHVVQQTARPGQSAGRRALESEADLAASAILSGRSAAVALGASMGAALAFSDSEDHEIEDQPDVPAPGSAQAAGAATSQAAAPEEAETPAPAESEADDAALLADIRTTIPADAAPAGGGAGGGGGGEAVENLEAEAPEVSSAPPEQGLAALQGVRPDRLAPALGGVRAAASSEVTTDRDALAQDPPEQMSTGDAMAESAPGTGGAGGVAGEDAPAAVPPGQAGAVAAAGQEQQAAVEQAATGGTDMPAVTSAPPPPVAAAMAPAVENAPADGENASGGMSEADIGRMSSSLDLLPTSDPHASTDPGAAPELAVTEDAAASAEAQRDALDTSISDAEGAAATDIAQPMGEDHIETTLAPEPLEASFDTAAAAAEAGAAVAEAGAALQAAPGQALGSADEAVGIIAQLEKRAEIDAALADAQAQVATERQAHADREAEERARVDEEIAALQVQSEADQAQAREEARTQVDQARSDWQAEVDAQSAAARAEAEAEVTAGMSDIEAEQVRANAEAQRHIDQGRADAEAEQRRGEEEAERVKEEKEEESGGFFGWLASQAEAFFEGVKQAISDALEAARQAIQAVIEAATRLATEVIEAARQVIVAAIQAVGEALIAIGDRLLAAFPELRERFRETIQGFVDAAVEAVNAIAETLKEGVQQALDLLGQALNAALSLLEQGLHAIVDAVGAVVQGAISFAEGMVEMLGAFAVLIKDIAADPGGWLGKLGAAAMDGIQNHLWGALTSAVMAWFQDKVLELLGIGGIILQVLMEGGIDLTTIRDMAWEALQSAIPMALIAILIEKVVAMIVPAAGAVMAIIEGLQAAWGTVSRIIAAFGAFVAFLQAVKTGAAGPQFANMLAMAAVVVIDFVANWLLRKLMSAARRVGAKLRALAERFRRRRQRRRPPGRRPGQPRDRDDDDDRDDDRPAADLRAEAQRAAQRGWNAARRRSGQRVVRASELQDALRSSERNRGGIRVDLELVQAGDQWKVRATARKGASRATAEAGHGWITRSKSGALWYGGKSIKSLHQRLIREASRELRQTEGGGNGQTLQQVYQAKERLARTLERRGQQQIAQQLDGIRYTIRLEPLSAVENDQKIQTRLLIEPNYEEMELQLDAAKDDVFEQLVKDLDKQTQGRTFKHEDVILGICERVASPLGIQTDVVYMRNPNASLPRSFILVKFKARVGNQQKEHKAFIVQKAQNTQCAACESQPGVIEPHNVVPQTLWRQGIRGAFGILGVASETAFMGYIIESAINWSASRRESQKQCEACERPGSQNKTGIPGGVGPNAGSDYSLIQRGFIPNATSDDSITGRQFGGAQAGLGDRQATTRAHVGRIIVLLRGDIKKQRNSSLYAGDAVITANLVDDAHLDTTLATIAAEIYRLSN